MMLSGLIGITSVLASWGIRERVRTYFSLLLLTQAAVNGAIAAHDMFVLILFWGAVIIPIALLVLGWGGPRRDAATWRLIGYWAFGTAALIAATMTAYAASGTGSFGMDVLLKSALAPRVQLAVGLGLIVAAATRLPLFPFHGWVRDLYSEAPLGLSVVVAGSASRLGAYLLLRTLVAAHPDATRLLSPLVVALAALTIIYAALVALRSADLRWSAAHLAMLVHRVLVGRPNRDGPAASDASLGETWYLGLLAGGLLWVGLFPGGPKLPGTDQPVFDPGLLNIMSAGITDIASPYVAPAATP